MPRKLARIDSESDGPLDQNKDFTIFTVLQTTDFFLLLLINTLHYDGLPFKMQKKPKDFFVTVMRVVKKRFLNYL